MVSYRQVNQSLVAITEEEETAIAEEKAASNAIMLNVENRNTRNALLASSDWTQMPDSPLTDEAKTSWATYRSSLRDLPTSEGWPSVTFPTEPS